MKLKEIYDLAVSMGIEADPRGGEAVRMELATQKKKWEKLSAKEREFFDPARFTNPYADTRILAGDTEAEIGSILSGIDMEVAEVLLADRLNQKGEAISLILAHHPEGSALAGLADAMHLQEGYMAKFGVLPGLAVGIMEKRIEEVDRSLSAVNHHRAVDAARILGFAFLCVHTPADNLATQFLYRHLESREILVLDDIVEALREIPEYADACHKASCPKILVGNGSRPAGKIYVDFTGGTGGPHQALEKIMQVGVNTMLCMHMGEKHIAWAKKNHLNIVLAGHIASDSLGMNLYLDEIERQGVKIIPASGLVRIKRY